MPDVNQGRMTALPPATVAQAAGSRSLLQRAGDAISYVITGAGPAAWFGPMQPIGPMAPEDVKGRGWDYPVGYNLDQRPRGYEPVSFDQLRMLSRSCDTLRLVIETRKDQLGTLEWSIRPRKNKNASSTDNSTKPEDPRITAITEFLQYPDKVQTWDQWQRSLLEDLFVIDAATVYKRPTRGGGLYALELIDGATIKPLLDGSGRPPMPPDPCYQQILHGIPAVNYTAEELMYSPRNTNTVGPYGYSPVEQILLTVNIAIRRAMHQLEYYREGSQPDAFVGLPKDWNVDQIKAFDNWFNSTMSGNLAARRKVKFLPEFKYQETKQPPLKDAYDDYLNRVIAYAFSVSPQALVSMMNRATAGTAKASAIWEGVVPIMRWMEALMTRIIRENFNAPDLEFKYSDDLEQDREVRDRIIDTQVKSGRMTLDEARIADGREPFGGAASKPMVFTASGYVSIDPDERAKAAALAAPPQLGHNGGPALDTDGNPGPNAPKPPQLAPPAKAAEDAGKLNKAAKKIKIKPSSLDRPKVKKAEAKLANSIQEMLNEVKAKIIDQVKTKLDKVEGDFEYDIGDGYSILVSGAEDALSSVAEDSAQRILAQFSSTEVDDLFDRVNEDAVAFARDRAAEMIGMKYNKKGDLVNNPDAKYAISDTTRNDVKNIISNGLKDNIGRDAIIAQLEDAPAFSAERAEMVARTEIARANSQGELISYKAARDNLGLTITKSWMVADAPCEICEGNGDAGELELEADFPSGDDAPPGHPNCRCALETNVTDNNENEEE